MKKCLKVLTILSLIFLLVACATIKEKWDKLSPQEQNRLILNGIQKSFNDLFIQARDYVVANPKYEKDWTTKILPAFNVANRALKQVILESMEPSSNLTDLLKKITPLAADVKLLLKEIGFDPTKFLTNI
jgi:hypothetical protein